MLDQLRAIVQEVSSATSLDEAVGIIVRRVKEAIGVDVCSVYLTDPGTGRHVLTATDGLHPEAVGRVILGPGEGLVGLVGERREPVNLDHASAHPRYRYFAETGEERFHAFVGVPIVHYRQLLGVLVAQQREPRLFAPGELAFLVTIAAQLAGAIQTVTTSGRINPMLGGRRGVGFIQGVRGAPGVAIGSVVVAHPVASLESVPERQAESAAKEELAFLRAVTGVQENLREGALLMGELPSEARALFAVYVAILGSDSLQGDTLARIRAGQWAPSAWRDTIVEHARVFDQMQDPYLRARGEDLRDIGRRVLARLRAESPLPREYPARCVLVGEEISVTQVAEVPADRLAALVSLRGSTLSHVAVLARALGIPAVMGLGPLPLSRIEGQGIVVDGYQGRVYIQPAREVVREYQRLVREDARLARDLTELRDRPAETPDGVRMPLYVNTGLLADIAPSLRSGADGVGLYRTEFPFMVRESFPGEEEQTAVYRQVLEAFYPQMVTMRTLDVGGDKALPYFTVKEDNPFLGWRGIRVTLDHPELFLTQLRAMLRANHGLGNLQILLPMITRVEEVSESLELLTRAHLEVQEEGMQTALPRVGVMIEVPSAVFMAAALARRVDFLSVGTNDLTQYLLAVDRNNSRVASLYDSLHPGVLRALQQVVTESHRERRPVGICGEMAGEPEAAVLLLGMGVDSLSMTASRLPRIKWVLRSFRQDHARELLARALALEEQAAVRELVQRALHEAGLSALVGNPG
jgi:phosphotransferase system enzyme I (PtsP)